MPCYNGSEDRLNSNEGWRDQQARETRERQFFESALCAVMTALENNFRNAGVDIGANGFLTTIDWQEAGITRIAFEKWWKAHREKDRARREAEAVAEHKAKLKQQALEKLTPEEMDALGIPGAEAMLAQIKARRGPKRSR